MADAEHSKCFVRKGVWVRVPPPAHLIETPRRYLTFPPGLSPALGPEPVCDGQGVEHESIASEYTETQARSKAPWLIVPRRSPSHASCIVSDSAVSIAARCSSLHSGHRPDFVDHTLATRPRSGRARIQRWIPSGAMAAMRSTAAASAETPAASSSSQQNVPAPNAIGANVCSRCAQLEVPPPNRSGLLRLRVRHAVSRRLLVTPSGAP
jgi:hypothetical protein